MFIRQFFVGVGTPKKLREKLLSALPKICGAQATHNRKFFHDEFTVARSWLVCSDCGW
jgi:hypothetical protein